MERKQPKPSPPPVYRPQPPGQIQRKMTPPPVYRPSQNVTAQPKIAAPPVYRPVPIPSGQTALQPCMRPTGAPAQPKIGAPPPVYRPQPTALRLPVAPKTGIVQRAPEQVIVAGPATAKTPLFKSNIALVKDQQITVDYALEKSGRVPMFQQGQQVATVKKSDLIVPLKGPSQLPQGVTVDNLKLVKVNKASLSGIVQEDQWVTTYRAAQGTKLYHGTYPVAVASILSTGLKGSHGGSSGGSDYDFWAANCKGYVYLTTTPKIAGDAVKQFWLGQEEPENKAATRDAGKEGVPKKPNRNKQNTPEIAVLEVTVGDDGLPLEADPDLGGISLRTPQDVPKGWIKQSQTVAAGNKRAEYEQAAKEYKEYTS